VWVSPRSSHKAVVIKELCSFGLAVPVSLVAGEQEAEGQVCAEARDEDCSALQQDCVIEAAVSVLLPVFSLPTSTQQKFLDQ